MSIVGDGGFAIPGSGVNSFGCGFKVILCQPLPAEWKLSLCPFHNVWNGSKSVERQS